MDGIVKLLTGDAGVVECFAHSLVTFLSETRVVVIPEHCVDTMFVGDPWEFLGRVTLDDDEVAAALAVAPSQGIERIEQERHPGRACILEHVGVEDEGRYHGVVLDGRRERAVVGRPEVAAMPVDSHTRFTCARTLNHGFAGYTGRRVSFRACRVAPLVEITPRSAVDPGGEIPVRNHTTTFM